ncbi:MAG: GLPGLI family protein [Saprospiraceae bacterium]|nr:GLPGLI family protein [Saprospiraceae bacterium]HMW37882.1 GLPGLI family protein [Saprospiraceae bacterium]HMX87374.1 GLPGLI family protein [Saprospiraceae bacterium]HMZ39201.1 GLPGLI family protein [Saprospiraceae bacterium]HNA64154.1 GLPGLI family protein [Saprospiraceae bacterium]
MKKLTARIVYLFLLVPVLLKSQNTRIQYERTVNWSKIVQSLSFMSKEEKDRMAMGWGRGKAVPDPYILTIDSVQAVYEIDEDNLPRSEYYWRREKEIVHTQLISKKKLDYVEVLGKSFVFDEDLPKIKWKILNEIKEVAGYVCMKAETMDTVRNLKITAWFTHEIPISLGPENYYGLPGLILELSKNEDCAVITATKINLKNWNQPIKLPKKKKGKKTTSAKYNALISKHIKESIAAQRNPYWSIHY